MASDRAGGIRWLGKPFSLLSQRETLLSEKKGFYLLCLLSLFIRFFLFLRNCSTRFRFGPVRPGSVRPDGLIRGAHCQ